MEKPFKGRASCNFFWKENLSDTISNKDLFLIILAGKFQVFFFYITDHLTTLSFTDAAGICFLTTLFVKAILEHTFMRLTFVVILFILPDRKQNVPLKLTCSTYGQPLRQVGHGIRPQLLADSLD